METVSELQKKEVININTGERLGFVYDIDIDLENGKILSLRIPPQNKLFNIFVKNEDYIIPWDKIKKIGNDIILINP